MKNPIRLTLLLPLFLILTHCQLGQTPSDEASTAFDGYIQGHTAGVVSAADPIRIFLNQSLTGYVAGDQMSEELLDFQPAVAGKLWYKGDGGIEFMPDKALNNGKSYQVVFHLGKLLEVPKELREFKFKFEVMPLDFSVLRASIKLAPKNLTQVELMGRIRTADYIDQEALLACFSIESPLGSPQLVLESSGGNNYNYSISNLNRGAENYELLLKWNGKSLGIDQKGEQSIVIPGQNQFDLLDVFVEQGADQHLRLDFSAEIDPAQELKGLIYLAQAPELTIRRSGNQVFLYPSQRLSGEWKLHVEASVRSSTGKSLGEQQIISLAMDALAPQVVFLGSGYVLPNSDGLLLPIRAVNLRAVDLYVYRIFSNNVAQFLQSYQAGTDYSIRGAIKYVGRPALRKTIRLDQDPSLDLKQWNTFSFDLAPLIQTDPHALYHVEIRIRQSLALNTACAGLDEVDLAAEMLPEQFSEADLSHWQDGDYYYEDLYPDNFDWQERDNPCHESYYTPDKFVYRNVLATNLGVLAKSSDNKNFFVAVTDLLSADPVSNASVEFFNFQQQQILVATTDPDGMVEVKLNEVPYLVVVSKDDQKVYLRVDDGSVLSMSNFDVSGQAVQKGLKGFIYGERGVWRPGDSLHLSFILFDKQYSLPPDIPVSLEVKNSMDQLVQKMTKTQGSNGFYYFGVPTQEDDPTGNWQAKITVGGVHFNKTLKVEAIKPNRLRMNLDFNQEILKRNDVGQQLKFTSSWLHGAPAANLRAEVEMRLAEGSTSFEGYDQFYFDDPVRSFWSSSWFLYDGYLDGAGEATIPLNLDINQEAPGMLKAVFTSRVFEKGGDFSTDVLSKKFSPYRNYIGVKTQNFAGADEPLATDTLHQVEVVSLNENGDPVSLNGLITRVYKIGWRWWWSSGSDDLASYVGSRHENLIAESRINTINGKGNFSFKVEYPHWGRFLIHVEDPRGGHAAGQIIYMDWPAWVNRSGRSNPSGANMLSLSADRDAYETGDQAVITFPSIDGARALLSIESGSEILKTKWIKCKKDETRVEINIEPEMAPTVYVSVTMIQAHEHTGNDLPIRQYGVIPLHVEDPTSKLEPVLELPEEIRPNASYQVSVSEAHGQAMTYTLAIVDEGLLDLTRFKTPDPWSAFFAREALGIKTWDLYDEVIGAYGGRMESLLAIGGDDADLQADQEKANRFDPVVSFLGPFELKKGRSDKHILQMPNYIGSVRVMVVAGAKSAWGAAEVAVPVRQPLMVLTTLPRILAPAEKVMLPVNLFVMKENLPDATVRVITEGPVYVDGSASQVISLNKLGEEMLYFTLRTADESGVAKITVIAESQGESASHTTEIAVRNPNPFSHRSELMLVEPTQQVDLTPVFFGSPGTNSGTVEISRLPALNLKENVQFLIQYPYGCLEQTTSAGFAQLFLADLVELSENEQAQTERNIKETIKRLSRFQLPAGGFAYWPGQNAANLWGSTYAAHFLLEAEKTGFVLPYGMRNQILSFIRQTCSSYKGPNGYNGDSELQQAYRLYTLALAGEPNLSAMNRLREGAQLQASAAWRLAAAYALAGRSAVAKELTVGRSSVEPIKYDRPGPSFGSALRDRAMMVETLILLDDKVQAFKLIERIAKEMEAQRWSTQSTAFGLLALAQFVKGEGESQLMKFNLSKGGDSNKIQTNKAVYQTALLESDGGKNIQIENLNESNLFVTLTTQGQETSGSGSAAASNLSLELSFVDLGNQSIDVSEIRQGDTFKAIVLVNNPAVNGRAERLALSQIFPSGWEILNTRFVDDHATEEESSFEFRDIRDDRVNTFFSLEPGRAAQFVVRLNAAYEGDFYMPGLTCEEMYRTDIYARTAGMWVRVIK